MAKSPIDLEALEARLDKLGLVVFGRFEIHPDQCAEGRENWAGSSALLIGNVGKAMWEIFRVSQEFADGQANPMNRWTSANIDPIASEFGATAIYPFDTPYWPFQQFAKAATGMRQSPLGLLVHSEYGLWQAFRGALVLPKSLEFSNHNNWLARSPEKAIHPCDECVQKPCLTACPVDAFDGASLDVKRCFGHLDGGDTPFCMEIGCRARDACPVGTEHRYLNAQKKFHMKSYRGDR